MKYNSRNIYQQILHHKPVKYNPQWLLPCCLPKGYQKIPTQEIVIRNENRYNFMVKKYWSRGIDICIPNHATTNCATYRILPRFVQVLYEFLSMSLGTN